MISGVIGCALELVGLACIITLLLFFCRDVSAWLGDKTAKLVYKHKIKNRFKNKPVAKCYCIDCIYREDYCKMNGTGQCVWFQAIVNDDAFCNRAVPRGEEWQPTYKDD